MCEENHREGRGQGESDPCRDGSRPAGATQPQADADLTARRPREELAEGDEVGIATVIEPAAALDEFRAEVAQVRDRAAEGNQAQLQESEQDFENRTMHGAILARMRGGQSLVPLGLIHRARS